jgi:protoporphyrinogen oxidase
MAVRVQSPKFDAVIIGGGLGGLLTAAHLTKVGMHVLVAEKLAFLGGRFSNKNYQGYALSTGALHYVPHGPTGILGQSLAYLGLEDLIEQSQVFASIFQLGKHNLIERPIDLLKILSLHERLELITLMLRLKASRRLPQNISFGSWLHSQSNSHNIFGLWNTFSEFALSITVDDIGYEEMRAVVKSVVNLGDPGIIRGGCDNIIRNLVNLIESRGGKIHCSTEATGIHINRGRATGITLMNRPQKKDSQVAADYVISDIGPAQTIRLLPNTYQERLASLNRAPVASGLKIHFSSDKSLIPHNGIMFCANTKRISGVVQPTNADPHLAPPGKHLLISFQVLKSDDLVMERHLALEDLHYIFGEEFEKHCKVLSSSIFRSDKWPVNRAKQGSDLRQSLGIERLWLVGDAVKPIGYMMVEGVAKSVDDVLGHIISTSGMQPDHYRTKYVAGTSALSYVRRILKM